MHERIRHPIRSLKRWRPRSRREVRRRPINILASALTTLSLYCGIASIFAAIDGDYRTASFYIFGALVFDMFDGTVARLTKSVTEFGKNLDSLSDVVSFGVAPAVLIFTAYLNEEKAYEPLITKTGPVIAIIYGICAALRLARYNVYQSDFRDHFIGLPSPAAGATVASFVLFMSYAGIQVAFWALGPLTLALAYLMVSTVRYPKGRIKALILAPRSAFRTLVALGIVIALVHYAITESISLVMFPLAVIYVLFGIGDEIYLRAIRRPRPSMRPVENHESPVESVSEEPPPSKTGDLL
jgi:CDP-diacylglycerol---serine O-phosphatidyltransferase